MRKNIKRAAWMVAGLVLAAVLAGSVYMANRWNTPLGPGLGLATDTLAPTSTATVKPAAVATGVEESTATAAPTETPTPAPLCGGPAVMTVMALGVDSDDLQYLYGLADVIRVVRIDFVHAKVSMLSLPRDLWVRIPDIAGKYGITHGKLNQAFLYGGKGMGYYNGPGYGPGLMARTLEANFGIRVDHYGAVNMLAFIRIIDALHGIDVFLPEPVDGTSTCTFLPGIKSETCTKYPYFTAGQHHFSGIESLMFSRIRKTDNEFQRQDRISQVLCAVRNKLVQPEVLASVPDLVNSLIGNVLTDLTPAEITALTCLAPRIGKENIFSGKIPQEWLSDGWELEQGVAQPRSTYVLHFDEEKVKELMAQYMSGAWPAEKSAPMCE